jgi:hypothetical protein
MWIASTEFNEKYPFAIHLAIYKIWDFPGDKDLHSGLLANDIG